MSTLDTIAADIEKAVRDLRPGDSGADLWVHYINRNDVAVKRRVGIGAEVVDGEATRERAEARRHAA